MHENSKGVFFASWASVTHELSFVGSWREPVAWVVDAELVAADILKSKCQSGESKERNAKRRKEKKKKKEEEKEKSRI
jgi:hypothetical protein